METLEPLILVRVGLAPAGERLTEVGVSYGYVSPDDLLALADGADGFGALVSLGFEVRVLRSV